MGQDEHIIGLEEKVAYLEKQLSDLDSVVRDQGDEIVELRRRVTTLNAQIDQHTGESQTGRAQDPAQRSEDAF